MKKLTPPNELEELQKKRAEMEEESRLLHEKERNLDERVRILEERIAIQDLQSGNQMKMQAVKDLEAKLEELEKRLTNSPAQPEAYKPPQEPTPEEPIPEEPTPEEPGETEQAEAEPAEEEPEEEYVEVAPAEDSLMPQEAEQVQEDYKKQHEKKKRRLF